MSNDNTRTDTPAPRRHKAGLFDIRYIIGALLGIYGIVLLLTDIFGGSGSATSGPAHSQANLWTGAALLVVGIFFIGWATIRPTVVDEEEPAQEMEQSEDGPTPKP